MIKDNCTKNVFGHSNAGFNVTIGLCWNVLWNVWSLPMCSLMRTISLSKPNPDIHTDRSLNKETR